MYACVHSATQLDLIEVLKIQGITIRVFQALCDSMIIIIIRIGKHNEHNLQENAGTWVIQRTGELIIQHDDMFINLFN